MLKIRTKSGLECWIEDGSIGLYDGAEVLEHAVPEPGRKSESIREKIYGKLRGSRVVSRLEAAVRSGDEHVQAEKDGETPP